MPSLSPEAGYPLGTVGDSESDLIRPLHDVLTSEFARLGQQLRQDMRRELRCNIREMLISGPSGRLGIPESSPKFQDTANFSRGGGVVGGSEEHHEWTRRHVRGFLAQEYLESFPEAQHQQRTPRKVGGQVPVSRPEAGNSSGPELQEVRSPGGNASLDSTLKTLPDQARSGSPLNTTLKSLPGQGLNESLRRVSEDPPEAPLVETPVMQVVLLGVPDVEAEAEVGAESGELPREILCPSTGSTGAQLETPCRHENRLLTPATMASDRPSISPLGGRYGGEFGRTPKAVTSWTPQRALGLVPSRTQFVTLTNQDPSTCHYKMSYLVCNIWFERVTLFMNFASAALVGAQTEYMARSSAEESELLFFRVTDWIFLTFFILEAALRLFVYRRRFFRMSGWGWNVFDLFLIVIQFTEEVVIRHAVRGKDLWSTLLLRIVRVLRTIKLFRVMGHVAEFRLLVMCILHSFKSFLWAVALLLLLNFCVATYLVQVISSSRHAGVLSQAEWESLREWYGSLGGAVFSIFLGLTGGVDWNDIVVPIKDPVPEAAWIFIVFMLFAILALLNIVSGTFVQNAIDRAEEVKQINKVQQARKMFKSLDVDSSGFIGFSELNDHLDNPEVQGYFRSVDVDLSEARCLFDMLDMNDSGTIDFEEFLSGCIRLQGPARSLDLLMVARDMRCAFQRMATRLDVIEMNTRLIASAPSLLREDCQSEADTTT